MVQNDRELPKTGDKSHDVKFKSQNLNFLVNVNDDVVISRLVILNQTEPDLLQTCPETPDHEFSHEVKTKYQNRNFSVSCYQQTCNAIKMMLIFSKLLTDHGFGYDIEY